MIHCEMSSTCDAPVTHIGDKGYIYCREHAASRRDWERTRALRRWEIRWLAAGKALPSYAPVAEPMTGRPSRAAHSCADCGEDVELAPDEECCPACLKARQDAAVDAYVERQSEPD